MLSYEESIDSAISSKFISQRLHINICLCLEERYLAISGIEPPSSSVATQLKRGIIE